MGTLHLYLHDWAPLHVEGNISAIGFWIVVRPNQTHLGGEMSLIAERVLNVGGGLLHGLDLVGLSRPDGGAVQASQNGVHLATQEIRLLRGVTLNNDVAKLGASPQSHMKNNIADAVLGVGFQRWFHRRQKISAAAQETLQIILRVL